MSLDLIYERLALERIEAENAAETVVEGTVTLPERSAEIGRALKLQAAPKVSKVEVREGRSSLKAPSISPSSTLTTGNAASSRGKRDEFDDEYDDAEFSRSEEVVIEEQLQTASWRNELPFVLLLDLPGISEGEEIETTVDVRSTSFEVRSDRFSVDVDVVLAFSARSVSIQELTVAKAVKGASGVDAERRSLRVTSFLGRGGGMTEAQGELSLTGRAVPERILDVRAQPVVTEAAADDGVVRVRGYLNYSLFYVGAGGAGPQYSEWVRGATFEMEADIPTAVRGASCDVTVTPQTTECRIVDDEGARQLDVRTPLALDIRLKESKEVAVITGLESKEKEVAARRQLLRLLEAVGETKEIQEEESTLDLPQGLPGIDRILFGNATAVVDDVHVLGDKVAVELARGRRSALRRPGSRRRERPIGLVAAGPRTRYGDPPAGGGAGARTERLG